jgi:hypothetical protein
MKTLQEIKKEAENKRTELFKEVGLFWAFSNEQFNENKTPLKEGEKYVSIGSGGYLPKSNYQKFKSGFKDINNWEKTQIKNSKKLIEDHIKYELNNYECYYTGDITPALSVLPYPKKDILKIFYKEKEKYQYS